MLAGQACNISRYIQICQRQFVLIYPWRYAILIFMGDCFLSKIFFSHYCKVIWLLSLFAAYLMIPHHLFSTMYFPLAILFMIGFATMMTCMIRNIKDKIVLARSYKSSIWGILASVFGLTALQLCGLGNVFCGGSIFLGVLSAIFPGAAVNLLSEYAVEIIVFSILMQIFSIWQMDCFRSKPKTNQY